MKKPLVNAFAGIAFWVLAATPAFGEAMSEEELARQSLNPIASLISLPFQFNADYGIGPADAKKLLVNIQPVVPFSLTKDWNLITRTILPLIDADSALPGGDDKAGIGDVQQSFFFTPTKDFNGWMIGAGPALLYPTASSDTLLGGEKWCAGPTFVALKQQSGFTWGMLFNHLWSFAGVSDRNHVSATFMQPFLGYTTKTFTTLMVSTESTYDWRDHQWTVPLNVLLTQMLKIGDQPISLQLGYRYYAETPEGGPDWGLRFTLTFLFPK